MTKNKGNTSISAPPLMWFNSSQPLVELQPIYLVVSFLLTCHEKTAGNQSICHCYEMNGTAAIEMTRASLDARCLTCNRRIRFPRDFGFRGDVLEKLDG